MTTLLEKFVTGIDMDSFCWPYVIAGGALRDSWFDKPVNDVDVFVAVPPFIMKEAREKGWVAIYMETPTVSRPVTVGFTPCKGDIKLYMDGSTDYPEGEFVSFRSSEHPGLNIIFRKFNNKACTREEEVDSLVKTLFEEFPCSISKLAYHPPLDKWWVDDEFKETLKTGVVVFSDDVTEKYRNKIFPKYKDMFKPKKSTFPFAKLYGHSILRSSV